MERQNPTIDDTIDELTPQQSAAVDLLATGRTVTETAETVGVSRQTVSGWLNQNCEFRSRLGQRRSEIWDGASDRLRSLLPKALELIEQELQAGRIAAATTVLRAAGLYGLSAPAVPRDAREIELDDREARAERQRRAMLADLLA